MTHVMACIDGSASAPAVCDYAAWAALRMNTPLTFLHVLDHARYPIETNLSGSIGLGSQEALLEELASLDEKRSKLALEQGRLMLDAARDRAVSQGVTNPATRQRHGGLAETLAELEADIRLLVLGKQGEDHPGTNPQLIGSNLERVIRTLHRPLLITPAQFQAPQRILFAFDGSETSRKAVEMVAYSLLFVGLPCHLVMVGADSAEHREQLAWALSILQGTGFDARGEIRGGDVEETLRQYKEEHQIDLMIMGAYGHSRIRQFLVGSTTTNMIRNATVPLLVLR